MKLRHSFAALLGMTVSALTSAVAAGAQPAGQIAVGPTVQVSASRQAETHYEVLAAVDPRHPSRLIVGSFIYPERGATATSIVYASRDGGKSWSPTLHGDALANTSDPAPAYGPDGTAYYTVSALGPAGTPREERRMLVYRSPDGGATWEGPFSFTYSDRQYVTVDATGGPHHGRIYVNGNNRIPYGVSDFVVFFSDDRGRTWQGPGKREGFGRFTAASMGNAVVASDGTLIGVFTETGSLHAIASEDGGRSLTPAVTIDAQYVSAGNRKGAHNNVMGMPVIAIDGGSGPRQDHLYVVWADRRTGRSRIFFSSSADRGATWSRARPIDDREPGDSTDHFMPTVAVNPTGVVGVMWYDRRRHSDNLGWDARFTASMDGGETFLPSVQVSEQGTTFGTMTPWTALRPSVARAGGDGTGIVVDVSLNSFMFLGGDTNGLVADANGVFHPVWVDNRTGIPQIWTAPVTVSEQPPVARGVEISSKVTFEILENWFDRASGALTVVVQLRNVSTESLRGPFRVEVLDVSSQLAEIAVTAADNGREGPGAEWTFAQSVLAPAAVSPPKTLRFVLSDVQPFRSGDRYRLGLLQLKVRVTHEAPAAARTNR